MKHLKTKLFITFLAGILFSTFAVFAATISVSTNFTTNAVQYLQQLVLRDSSGTTGIVLDGINGKIMSNTICDKTGSNCKITSQLITGSALSGYLTGRALSGYLTGSALSGYLTGSALSGYLTGSALSGYLTGTKTFLTGANLKWCIMSGGTSKISCFEDKPGNSLWNLSGVRIYYNTGNVGIGTTGPQYKLDVNGTGRFTQSVLALAFLYNSDIRLKQDITVIDSALDKILALNGYQFVWRKNGSNDIGVIAQEVEQQFPNLVVNDADGFKAVKYPNLVAPIIQAIKEFYAKYIVQEKKIYDLEQTVLELKDTVEKLETKIDSLD